MGIFRRLPVLLVLSGTIVIPLMVGGFGANVRGDFGTLYGGEPEPAGQLQSPWSGSHPPTANFGRSGTTFGYIGDPNSSQSIDIDDITYLIAYIFGQGAPPIPVCTGDVDGSGRTDIDDVVFLITYVFAGGPPPVSFGSVIPRPVHSVCCDEDYDLAPSDTIWIESEFDEAVAVGRYLAGKLSPSTGYYIEVHQAWDSLRTGIVLRTDSAKTFLGDEGYELTVTSGGIILEACMPEGLFRGIQTIRQLLPDEVEDSTVHEGPWTIPGCYILDYPRFAWRGFLLDVVRHFFDIETVKHYIDLLAYYKMNVFHWHLTDDQGWRPEIAAYPLLNETGSWRGDDNYGGYYTKEEMESVAQFAAARFIKVVPEVEMPGHSTAAVVSYPHLMCEPIEEGLEIPEVGGIYNTILCAGQEPTLDIIKAVLDEIVEVFPSSVIHIGGDEVPKDRWIACPYCQTRIDTLGLADEEELQEWFMKEISWYLYDTHGRNTSGWSEGGVCQDSMPPGTIAQWWAAGDDISVLAQNGYDVINTSYLQLYLDKWYCTLPGIYGYDLTGGTDSACVHHVLGAEVAMWTEYVQTEAELADKVFPRLIAAAENAWTPKSATNYAEFYIRLLRNLRCLDYMGVEYGGMEQ